MLRLFFIIIFFNTELKAQKLSIIQIEEKVYADHLTPALIDSMRSFHEKIPDEGANRVSRLTNFEYSVDFRLLAGDFNNNSTRFRLVLSDVNKNGYYNDLGIDEVIIAPYGLDSVYILPSPSMSKLKNNLTISYENFCVELVNLNFIGYYKYEVILKDIKCGVKTDISFVSHIPDISFRNQNEEEKSLRNVIDDSKLTYIEIVNAYMCPHPSLESIHKLYNDKINIISLHYKSSIGKVKKCIGQNNIEWENGLSDDSINYKLYQNGFPYGILFDESGKIIKKGLHPFKLKSYLETHIFNK